MLLLLCCLIAIAAGLYHVLTEDTEGAAKSTPIDGDEMGLDLSIGVAPAEPDEQLDEAFMAIADMVAETDGEDPGCEDEVPPPPPAEGTSGESTSIEVALEKQTAQTQAEQHKRQLRHAEEQSHVKYDTEMHVSTYDAAPVPDSQDPEPGGPLAFGKVWPHDHVQTHVQFCRLTRVGGLRACLGGGVLLSHSCCENRCSSRSFS